MNFKAVIAVVLVIGIGLLLMQTQSGKVYFGSGLDFLKTAVGNFVSGAFTYGGLFGQQIPQGLTFRMSLSAPRQSFYGQNYTVTNASLQLSGVCTSAIDIGSISLHKEAADCDIALPSASGLFEYTAEGNVVFSGSAAVITLDGTTYTSSGQPGLLKTSFTVAPLSFTLGNIAQPLMTLEVAEGSIMRLADDGAVKSTEQLKAESLQIAGFMGFLKLDGPNIVLQGSAVAVRGTGEHSSFIW